MRHAARAATIGLPAAAAMWWARGQPSLAPPQSCPGLLDLLGAAALRMWPDALFAAPFSLIHLAAAAIAVAALAVAVVRTTTSHVAAVATCVAWAAAWMWLPSLSVPDSVAVAVAALTWLGLARLAAGEPHTPSPWTLAGLIASAAIAPSLAVPAVIVVAWLVWRPPLRGDRFGTGRAIAWVVAACAAPVVVALGVPAIPSVEGPIRHIACIVPALADRGQAADALALGALAGFGPLFIALLVLGLADRAASLSRRFQLVATAWLAGALVAAWSSPQLTLRVAAPLIAGAWLVAGWGYAAVVTQAQRARAFRVAGVASAAMLAALMAAPRFPGGLAPQSSVRMLGHDQLTNTDVRRLVTFLPAGAVIVREDAMIDLHLRALAGRLSRSRPDLRQLGVAVEEVSAAMAAHRVFAWPSAQKSLVGQGLRVIDSLGIATLGVAELQAGGPCTELSRQWQSANGLAGTPALTMVAGSASARGPILIWLSGQAAIDAAPKNWPPPSARGFHRRVYELPDERVDLASQVAEDRAPPLAEASGFVTRLELWRTPEAPEALTVSLSAPATHAIARLRDDASSPVRVCPSFLSDVLPIPTRR